MRKLLNPGSLASHIGVNSKTVSSFLTRHAEKFKDCRIAVESKKPNEPAYLYRTTDVLPFLKQLQIKHNP